MVEFKKHYKYIIIGAGPAGLQTSYFLHHVYKQDYLILEKSEIPGSFFQSFPKSRKLISINKTHNFTLNDPLHDIDFTLRSDWNSLICENQLLKFGHFSTAFYPHADDFMKYLNHFSESFRLNVLYNSTVKRIEQNSSDKFLIHICKQNTSHCISCDKVIIATGLVSKDIPNDVVCVAQKIGATLIRYSEIVLNLKLFEGTSIAIIGTGNSAFETADALNEVTASIAMIGPTKLAWKTHYPGHVRSVNLAFIDTFYLKMGNVMYLDVYDTCQAILIQQEFLKHCNSKISYIIYCGGFQCNMPFVDNCKPLLDSNGYPKLTSTFESINVKNMFFAGANTHGQDYKQGTSSFIHGFRYNIEFLCKALNSALTPKVLSTISELETHMQNRINFCSCLHNRHGWFCDVIVIWPTSLKILYYEKLHIPFAREANACISSDGFAFDIFSQQNTIKIFLKLSYDEKDFRWELKQEGGANQMDIVVPFRSDISKFLHPVFELTLENKKTFTYHVGESPTGLFTHPIHTRYIQAILIFALSQGTFEDIQCLEKKIIDLQWFLTKTIK